MTDTKLDIDENGKYLSPPPPGTVVYLSPEDIPPPPCELSALDQACVVVNGRDGISRFVRLVEAGTSSQGVHFFTLEDGFYVSQKAALAAAAKENIAYYREKISRVLAFCKQLGIDPPPENTP